jgi:hypothetical protein
MLPQRVNWYNRTPTSAGHTHHLGSWSLLKTSTILQHTSQAPEHHPPADRLSPLQGATLMVAAISSRLASIVYPLSLLVVVPSPQQGCSRPPIPRPY